MLECPETVFYGPGDAAGDHAYDKYHELKDLPPVFKTLVRLGGPLVWRIPATLRLRPPGTILPWASPMLGPTPSDLLRRPFSFCALLLAFLACACSSDWSRRGAALPDLPQLGPGDFPPAVREQIQGAYEQARANPRDPSANGNFGMVLEAYGQTESAAVCFQRARLLEPDSFQWAYYLGVAQADLGKNADAAATLRQALELKPDYLPARLKQAGYLLASGDQEQSERIYQAIVAEHPDSAEAHYGLGRVRAAGRQWAGAADSYRKAGDLFPAYGAAHYGLALALRNLGETAESEQYFGLYEKNRDDARPTEDPLGDAIQQLNRSAIYRIAEGVELARIGQTEQAVAAHEEALERDPQLVDAHANLISLYGRLGQTEKVEQHYRAAVRLDPNHAESHYNYGVILAERGKFQAAKAFRKALKTNPAHPEAHANLGFILEQRGRVEEAVGHYRWAIQSKPDYRLAHYHLGRVLVLRKRYKEGIQHLQKTLTPEDETTPAYLYGLAVAYGRAGDLDNGLHYARQARQQAASQSQTKLLAMIERHLQVMEKRRR